MSLYNFVYNLQRKSKKAKQRILAGLLAVSFLILAGFWFFMFKNQLNQARTAVDSSTTKLLGEDQKLLSPVAALMQGFKGFKDDVTQKISEYKSNISAEPEKARTVYELPTE